MRLGTKNDNRGGGGRNGSQLARILFVRVLLKMAELISVLRGFLAVGLVLSNSLALVGQGKDNAFLSVHDAATPALVASHSTVVSAPNSVVNSREAAKYRRLWGIDDIHVRSTASGSLIRFSYRVVDKDKANIFMDKKSQPLLIDESTHLALQIPVMEKIGQLRQISKLQNGKEYWMAFSNKGHYVKPGNRVDLEIGKMRLEGLVIEGIASALH
jgi:hypothetical protein